MQEQICNVKACDRDALLSDWSEWTACSKVCGTGTRERARHVAVPPIGRGWCPSPEDADLAQTKACNEQACPSAGKCTSRIDLVFALDGSGSVGATGLSSAIAFVYDIVNRTEMMEDGTDGSPGFARLGLVQFGTEAGVAQALTGNKETFISSLANIPWQATNTNTGQSLALAAEMLSQHGREGAPRAVVVVTDGMPNSVYVLQTEADRLKSHGVRVSFVMVGPGLSRHAVQGWVSKPPTENVVEATSYGALGEEQATKLLGNLCLQFA